MTTTPFDARVAALDAGALTELMRGRHSVRAFTDRPIEGAVREALEAARLAPTALNQQRFRFELLEDGRTVRARALPTVSCGKVDLGIARLHFELGANSLSRLGVRAVACGSAGPSRPKT